MNALKIWNVELIPFGSERAKEARKHPEYVALLCDPLKLIDFPQTPKGIHLQSERALVYNQKVWQLIKKVNHLMNNDFGFMDRWYNLNSTQSAPEYVSETYLSLLITQYQKEGT